MECELFYGYASEKGSCVESLKRSGANLIRNRSHASEECNALQNRRTD